MMEIAEPSTKSDVLVLGHPLVTKHQHAIAVQRRSELCHFGIADLGQIDPRDSGSASRREGFDGETHAVERRPTNQRHQFWRSHSPPVLAVLVADLANWLIAVPLAVN